MHDSPAYRISLCAQRASRIAISVVLLTVAFSSGCSRIRLPAFDPTGARIFSPLPTTTGLALPGSEGEGCGPINALRSLHGNSSRVLSSPFTRPRFTFPTPAFVTPEDPPACPVPAAVDSVAAGASNEPCVPSAPCHGSCASGPRAVLLGSELDGPRCHHLPDRGKRGCILLSPQKIVAPVGGEVVLLSGICGNDGYLQMNERLEWMLTPDSVGTFIQVGDDEPGVIGKLIGSKVRPEKKDPSYAIGITSTKKALITRGNLDPKDDVQLEKGQTWLTISSPSEGISRVTVLAPESECWDQRKATATIYWVDAKWQFPSAQILPAGSPAKLTTRVTRSEGVLPATGWKVRYEILDPSLGSFAGTNGSAVVESTVDESGNATVEVIPTPGTSGITPVTISVVRPGGTQDNLPPLTLAQGQTFITWSSPKLAIRAGAPEVASFNVPFTVAASVSNPGDQPATNVTVDLPIPEGVQVIGQDSFARVLPNHVVWEIGTIPAQTELDISVDLTSRAPVELVFTARGDGLVAEDSVRVDVFIPSLTLKVAPLTERIEAGKPATFAIDVTNTSDRVLQNAVIVSNGDSGMIHESGNLKVESVKPEPLQPGETWKKQIVYTPTTAGRRCIVVEATASGGQRATGEACVIAINPVPDTPTLSARIDSFDRVTTGQDVTVTTQIFNEGRGAARNVRVEMIFDPQLQPIQATEGADNARLGQNIISWTVPEIAPGSSVPLAGVFRTLAVTPQARVRVQAQSVEGAAANANLAINILPAPATAPPPQRNPELPPASAPPSIPGGPGIEPLSGAPTAPTTPAPTGPVRSGRLLTFINNTTNPVGANQPIRYSVRIQNDSNVADSQIDIQIPLPPGVRLDRVNPLTNPELGQVEFKNDAALLPLVPNLAAGESVDYEFVLRSTQAQQFNFTVQVRSTNDPAGYEESVTTTVLP